MSHFKAIPDVCPFVSVSVFPLVGLSVRLSVCVLDGRHNTRLTLKTQYLDV